ncbi:hypothetical protein ACLGCZ_07690 [Helicobacter pylori]
MRQKNETATSFKELKEITQIMQAGKTSVQTNANAEASEPTQKSKPKPKATAHANKACLNPTKKAFSERQNTTFRDNSQASDEKRLKTEQGLTTHQQKGGKNEA